MRVAFFTDSFHEVNGVAPADDVLLTKTLALATDTDLRRAMAPQARLAAVGKNFLRNRSRIRSRYSSPGSTA